MEMYCRLQFERARFDAELDTQEPVVEVVSARPCLDLDGVRVVIRGGNSIPNHQCVTDPRVVQNLTN